MPRANCEKKEGTNIMAHFLKILNCLYETKSKQINTNCYVLISERVKMAYRTFQVHTSCTCTLTA